MHPAFPLINVENYRAFFPTKRQKKHLITLKVGGGESLLRVPTLLAGIVVPLPEYNPRGGLKK